MILNQMTAIARSEECKICDTYSRRYQPYCPGCASFICSKCTSVENSAALEPVACCGARLCADCRSRPTECDVCEKKGCTVCLDRECANCGTEMCDAHVGWCVKCATTYCAECMSTERPTWCNQCVAEAEAEKKRVKRMEAKRKFRELYPDVSLESE